MRIPLSWLREYVEIAVGVDQLIERLTLGGLEVASVQVYGLPTPDGIHIKTDEERPIWHRDKILIGRVLGVERHPNADRLTLATVDYGASQPKTVVTGATNIKPGDQGQRVVLALTGSVLFDGHAEQKTLRELKPSKIRGVASDAMVCSAYELGMSEEHEGIIVLDESPAPGTPAVDVLGDIVIEVDVLPNMARCLSMIGVSREVAALTGQTVRLPEKGLQALGPPITGKVEIEIEDPKLSARYAAGLIQKVSIGPAPGWMQRRLTYAGMRPISNIVDITNFVMLEWGQPLHAFDFDLLMKRSGGKVPRITVRRAKRGEKLTTLDGVLRELRPEHLIIADAAGPVAIAGVMGGAETEISEGTRNILLESANFDFLSVRRCMKELNLPSEASLRFSKGIHPETVRPAAERALSLMEKHGAGTACKGLVDVYPAPLAPQVIDLPMSEVQRILGFDFPIDEASSILRALEFAVERRDSALRVTAPPHRLDIQAGAADLIEELARVHGYDRMPATLLADSLPEQRTDRGFVLEERLRDTLVAMGLQEVMTYALTEPEAEAPMGVNETPYVELQNPISEQLRVMRHSVLASVLQIAGANLRHARELQLFELGTVYLPRAGERLPDELRRLAIILTGPRWPEFWAEPDAKPPALDFFDLKGIPEELTADFHIGDVGYRPAKVSWLHPGRSAEMVVGGSAIGAFGELHPSTAQAYGLGPGPVLAAELDLGALLARVPERFDFKLVPRYPPALRDIAIIVDEGVSADRVLAEIRTAGGALLAGARLFDVYRGPSIPNGKKSLAYALTYQAPDRTLIDKEVDKVHKTIEERVKKVLQAQIRGEEAAH
jgi:phenylalanyl-tRNA synthetase beta chain